GTPTVTILSSGNAVPAPIVLGPDTVPSVYAPDPGGGNIESTPITPTRSALDVYESIEGMRVQVNDARVAGPSNSFGEQDIATYNVENLAPSDPDAKYAALAQGVVTNLASPDIVALEEIQDNSGATDDGVVAADQTLSKLTTAIQAAGGPAYASRSIDPVND